jgi:predicted transcriptional regulator
MNVKKFFSLDDFKNKFEQKIEYREEYYKVKPYYQLAQQLIKNRIDSGLSQIELANKANTHQSRISKIESGELDFRLSTIINLAEALGCTVEIKLLPKIGKFDYFMIFNRIKTSDLIEIEPINFEIKSKVDVIT